MKCPYCHYEDTPNSNYVAFFVLEHPMIRYNNYLNRGDKYATLHACPKCGKAFIPIEKTKHSD